jgi:hypothetical protein
MDRLLDLRDAGVVHYRAPVSKRRKTQTWQRAEASELLSAFCETPPRRCAPALCGCSAFDLLLGDVAPASPPCRLRRRLRAPKIAPVSGPHAPMRESNLQISPARPTTTGLFPA